VQALVLCFRLHFAKDSTTINTAAAAVKQLVSAILDRVVAEDQIPTTGIFKIFLLAFSLECASIEGAVAQISVWS
jgi:hypothetical protein